MNWSSLQKRMSKFKAHLHGNANVRQNHEYRQKTSTLAYECRKKSDNIGTMCQCY